MTSSVSVAALALLLHRTEKMDLRLEQPAGTQLLHADSPRGYVWKDDAIEFDSLETRNRYAAEGTAIELGSLESVGHDELFEHAYQLWVHEIAHPDRASGRFLGLVGETRDVVDMGAKRIEAGADVFAVLHLLEASFPHLQTVSNESLTALYDAKHDRTKNDYGGGAIHSAVESWLAIRPTRAIEVHQFVAQNLSESRCALLCNATIALAKTDFKAAFALASDDINAGNPLRARVGIWSLGRLFFETNGCDVDRKDVTALISRIIREASGQMHIDAVLAATQAMHLTSDFDEQLRQLAHENDQVALSGIASTLFLKADELKTKGTTTEWLSLMSRLRPDTRGGLNSLDLAMSRLLPNASYAQAVADTLTDWVGRHGIASAVDSRTAEIFNGTLHQIWRVEGTWQSLVTRWLLSDDVRHPASLAGMLNAAVHGKSKRLALDPLRLESLEPRDLQFLGRRILAFVFDRELMTSLILSMFDVPSWREKFGSFIWEMLSDQIGYDYPGATIEACRAKAAEVVSAEAKALLQEVVDLLEGTHKTLEALPRRNELRPPAQLSQQFRRARSKQMSGAIDDARQKSILRQLATEIPIKAGSGTFSYRGTQYQPPMHMTSFSYPIEIPRREVIDPVGTAMRLFSFRVAERKKP